MAAPEIVAPAPNCPLHHLCAGEKYFAPTCAIYVHSPNHQTSPHPKSWRPPNSPPHHGCRGEKYFAPTCAIDALSPTRFDRTPAVRRRITDVRAKYFSPLRVPSMSFCPNNKHRHLTSVGRNRHSSPHHLCAGETYGAPTCAIYVHSPNPQKWPHHKSWRIPDVTTHRMCRGEIFFARSCATHPQSPHHQTSPHPKSGRPPQFAPTPRMSGRKKFRPYVCQRYPFAQPSNMATP